MTVAWLKSIYILCQGTRADSVSDAADPRSRSQNTRARQPALSPDGPTEAVQWGGGGGVVGGWEDVQQTNNHRQAAPPVLPFPDEA